MPAALIFTREREKREGGRACGWEGGNVGGREGGLEGGGGERREGGEVREG